MKFDNPAAQELYDLPLEDVMCHQLRALIGAMQALVASSVEHGKDAEYIAEGMIDLLKEL